MKKELKLIELNKNDIAAIIPPKDNYMVGYADRHPQRFTKLCKLLEETSLSKEECCRLSKIPKQTMYSIMKYAEGVYNYCEENGINYEDTKYFSLINTWMLIDEAYMNGTKNKINRISSAAEDVFDTDENGKKVLVRKGDWKADAFILSYARRNEFKEQEQQNHQVQGITIVLGDGGSSSNLRDIALNSQIALQSKMNNNED